MRDIIVDTYIDSLQWYDVPTLTTLNQLKGKTMTLQELADLPYCNHSIDDIMEDIVLWDTLEMDVLTNYSITLFSWEFYHGVIVDFLDVNSADEITPQTKVKINDCYIDS